MSIKSIIFGALLLAAQASQADVVELYCNDRNDSESFTIKINTKTETLTFNGDAVDSANVGSGSPQYIWSWADDYSTTMTYFRFYIDRQTLRFEYTERWGSSTVERAGICQKLDMKI